MNAGKTPVVVGTPTIDSAEHIAGSLAHLRGELARCADAYALRWVICVNGDDAAARARARRAIERYFETASRGDAALAVTVLEVPRAGRNSALNEILAFARRHAPDGILHCFDDDIRVRPGTLRRNLDAILERERVDQAPVLVGAALRARRASWAELRARHRGPLRALAVAFLQRVIATPYQAHSVVPRFCEGFCFGAMVKHMPDYPPDHSGVTDDTYLSNFFAVRGRARFERDALPPTHKPADSVGWMLLPHSYREWRRQQLRVHAGVLRSFQRFPAAREFLERYYAWPYAFNPSSRQPAPARSPSDRLFHPLYMLLHRRNHRDARRLVDAGALPAWGNAESAKPSAGPPARARDPATSS